MTSQTVKSEGSKDLAFLQTNVVQQEQIFGPLIALGSDGKDNLLTFEIGPRPPKSPVLEEYEGATPPEKPGHSLVCTGNCFVSSKSTLVAAYRPT